MPWLLAPVVVMVPPVVVTAMLPSPASPPLLLALSTRMPWPPAPVVVMAPELPTSTASEPAVPA